MSNYTGPVLLVPFVGPKDKFVLTLHSNDENEASIAKIVDRYAEDGYKIDLKHKWADGQKGIAKMFKVNGTLTPREHTAWPKLGFATRSAFLRG